MSTKPLQQSIEVARSVLSNVQPDQLSSPSPCVSWRASDVINHMVDAMGFFASSMRDEAPAEDKTDWSQGDFLAAFDEKSVACVQAFEAEGAMEKVLEMPFGQMPATAWLGLATTDIFTHAWDAAKATGQSTDLAPELAAGLLAQSKASIQESFRGAEGAPFGPEQPLSESPTKADELAAFLGRRI